MANKKMWLGMLVLVLTFGMTVVGCEEGGDTYAWEDPYNTGPSSPGASASNPINRVADTNLGTMTSSASGWQQLLNSINSKGEYINLYLSSCTMTGTSFNPDTLCCNWQEIYCFNNSADCRDEHSDRNLLRYCF